jgi:pimeloyl-ACP methyl ester carboxylesterase
MARVMARDGVALHAEAHGRGIPVVFSCGFATTSENFRPQVEPLVAAGARVVLWDYRSHGASEPAKTPDGYSIEQVVDDLARVLDWAAPGERAVVGGLSLGGLVSLHFALAHPSRTRGLILIDSGPGFKNPEAQARWTAQIDKMGERFEAEGLRAFVESRAAATAIGRFRELPAAHAAADAIARQDSHAVAEFGRRVAGPAPCVIDELGRIDVPALVVVGAEDEAYLRASEVLAAKLPRARRVVIPGAGHIVNIEKAAEFDAAVVEFLAELRAA